MRRVLARALAGLVGLSMVAATPMMASAGSWGLPVVHGGAVFAPPVVVRAGVVVGMPPAIVVAPPPIPVPRVEVVAPAPHVYGSVWVPGYWAWSGAPRGYHWVGGTWIRPPHHGAYWVPPRWSSVGAGHRWVDGHWGHRGGWGHRGDWGHRGHRGHR